MSEQNVSSSVETNGTVEQTESARIYASREEAEPNRPQSAKSDTWKVFEVTRPNGGETVYVWAFTGINAVNVVARHDGYDASAASRKARTVNVAATVTNALNNLDADGLKALGLPAPMVDAILAARQGSAVATSHVAAADQERDSKSQPKGRKGSKGSKGSE